MPQMGMGALSVVGEDQKDATENQRACKLQESNILPQRCTHVGAREAPAHGRRSWLGIGEDER